MFLRFLILVPVIALSGCSTAPLIVEATGGPNQAQVATAPRRQLSQPEQAFIQEQIASTLKDPSSAQFKHYPLVLWKLKNGGYVYCAQVNGKNSYGGYVGYSWSYNVIFPDSSGKITSVRPISIDSGEMRTAADLCSAYGYVT